MYVIKYETRGQPVCSLSKIKRIIYFKTPDFHVTLYEVAFKENNQKKRRKSYQSTVQQYQIKISD